MWLHTPWAWGWLKWLLLLWGHLWEIQSLLPEKMPWNTLVSNLVSLLVSFSLRSQPTFSSLARHNGGMQAYSCFHFYSTAFAGGIQVPVHSPWPCLALGAHIRDFPQTSGCSLTRRGGIVTLFISLQRCGLTSTLSTIILPYVSDLGYAPRVTKLIIVLVINSAFQIFYIFIFPQNLLFYHLLQLHCKIYERRGKLSW